MYTIIFYVWILWISFWFLQAFLFVFFRYCQSLWWAVLSVLVSSSDVGWLSGTFPGVADVWLHLSLAIIQLPKFFDRCEEKSARSLEVDAKLDAKAAASWINWNRAEHGWLHDPHTWVNVLQLVCNWGAQPAKTAAFVPISKCWGPQKWSQKVHLDQGDLECLRCWLAVFLAI